MSEVKKLKIGTTSYDVRDATTLQNLTSAQETTLLNTGTYNGTAISSGTVFTTDEGKFKEFEIDYTYSVGNATTQACDYSSKLSSKTNNAGPLAVMVPQGGTHIITNDGTNQNVYETPFTCMRVNYVNGVYFVSDSNHVIHKTTDFTNWTDFITLENATKVDVSIVLFNGYYYIAYRKTNNLCVLKVSLDGTSSETVLDTFVSASDDFGGGTLVSNGTYLCAFTYYLYTSTYYKTTDGSNWTTANFPTIQNIRSGLTLNGVCYLLNENDSKVYKTTDFSNFSSSSTLYSSGAFVTMSAYKNTLAVASARNGYVYVCTDLDNLTFTKYTGKTDDGVGSECIAATASGYVFSSYADTSYYVIPVSETSTYSLTALSYNKDEIAGAGFLKNADTTSTNLSIKSSDNTVRVSATGGSVIKSEGYKVTIGYNPSGPNYSTVVGTDCHATDFGIAIGYNARTNYSGAYYSIAIGSTSSPSSYVSASGLESIAIGYRASSSQDYGVSLGADSAVSGGAGVALGYHAKATASYAIQLGYGTNSTANTFSVGLSNSNNYQLLDSSGIIPTARIPSDVLKNAATGTDSWRFAGATTDGNERNYSLAIGPNAVNTSNYSTSIGYNARASGNGLSIGLNARAWGGSFYSIAIGTQATIGSSPSTAAQYATAIGSFATVTGNGAIQIGYGTNSTAQTFNVGFYDANSTLNYQLLDGAGHIPGPRMTLQGSAAPDTSTVGTVGQFYVDTTNQDAYICVSDASSTYTWKKITP